MFRPISAATFTFKMKYSINKHTFRGDYAQPLQGFRILEGQLNGLLQMLLHLFQPTNVVPGYLRK
jgi:hypothetical protein